MTSRKFYKTRIVVDVLSEEPIPPGTSIESIVFEAREGSYSMEQVSEKETVLNGKQAAKALIRQGSDPSFFQLDAKGNHINLW